MAFTKALYYPWIDIENETWLKNALLYWENIQTIVPQSIENPYQTEAAQAFYSEGLLEPLYVDSDMYEIDSLTEDVFKYFESTEGTDVLLGQNINEYQTIHPEKLPYELRDFIDLIEISPEKLPNRLRNQIHNRSNNVTVDIRFAEFYMTLLANRLSENTGVGLITDDIFNSKLANSVRLDNRISLPLSKAFRRNFFYKNRINRKRPVFLTQGTLSELIIEKIKIDPSTTVQDIIKFRTKHSDELGRFRLKIAELTQSISSDLPHENLVQLSQDIYLNEVKPSIDDLKKSLTDFRIRWISEDVLKVSFFKTSATSLPLVLLGVNMSQALLVGAGISLTASLVNYNRDKKNKLRSNPYSYLLSLERELSQ